MKNKFLDYPIKFFITGGSGFIGSALIRYIINYTKNHVLNYDKLTYAGNTENLASISKNNRYKFFCGDICDQLKMSKLLSQYEPDIVMNLAAETHVDRSIDKPSEFIKTNILGTSKMLECMQNYWCKLQKKKEFLFHHISTDEVYGNVNNKNKFTEKYPYDPSSPYSASKASSDHLVRAWHRTYGLPIIVTNCSNNYGPFQFPEKLIPLVILNSLEGKELPVYGNGQNIRDWLYVEDHVKLLYEIVLKGGVGETYNIGGLSEKSNIEVVNTICETLDKLKLDNLKIFKKSKVKGSFKNLITFVSDRPGHDFRYAVDIKKIREEFGWQPKVTFEDGILKTINWYINNLDWCENIQKRFNKFQRLGI